MKNIRKGKERGKGKERKGATEEKEKKGKNSQDKTKEENSRENRLLRLTLLALLGLHRL